VRPCCSACADAGGVGVWLLGKQPEAVSAESRTLLLERASKGTKKFVLGQPPWMLDTKAVQLGFGFYMD
jgi:hypothetical protein